MMKRLLSTAACCALLLAAGATTAGAAVTMALGASSQIPAAEGTARLKATKNGNIEIKLAIKHLAPPGRIIAGANVIVVWVRGLAPGAQAQNLGALQADKNLNAKITVVTAMSSFDLFLTCEQNQTAAVPSLPELLPLRYMTP